MTYDYLAFDLGKLMKDKFYSFMNLEFKTETVKTAVS